MKLWKKNNIKLKLLNLFQLLRIYNPLYLICSIWNVEKIECPQFGNVISTIWNVFSLEYARFGMCKNKMPKKWNLLNLECAQFEMYPIWNVQKIGWAQFGMCRICNVYLLDLVLTNSNWKPPWVVWWNSFIRFLEKFRIPKKPFEINRPLIRKSEFFGRKH